MRRWITATLALSLLAPLGGAQEAPPPAPPPPGVPSPALVTGKLDVVAFAARVKNQVTFTRALMAQLIPVIDTHPGRPPRARSCDLLLNIPEWGPLRAPASAPAAPRAMNTLALLLASEAQVEALWHLEAGLRSLCAGHGAAPARQQFSAAEQALARADAQLAQVTP